jgi:predicted RNase H-like nuclease (RuvC/YqgF family)
VDSLGQIIDRLQRENERLAGAVEEMRATSATREAEHRTRVHELQQLIADQAHEIRLLREQVARMRRGLTDTTDLHPEGT